MTNKEQINHDKLIYSIQKCKIHLARIDYSSSQVKDLFPLTEEKYSKISDATIGNIDQLVFRFTKLQDELGNCTFRYLLEFLKEDIADKPFRDILNILERLRIVESADSWLMLRELRNDLAHEYPTMIDETIEKLNFLYCQLPLLTSILSTIEQQLKNN